MDYSYLIRTRICELCKEKGITQNKLATLSGVRQSTIQNITSGNTRNPTLKTLHEIASGLEMTLAELLDIEEKSKG